MKSKTIPILKYLIKSSKMIFGSLIIQLVVMNTIFASGAIGYETELLPPIEVKGKVTSSLDGLPIPGVNVMIDGTSSGTITDIDGRYAISVPDENSTLVFSFVGFNTESVPVNGRSVIDVSLVEDIQSLSEVVVVGYGEQKKETLTGAIETISPKTFENRAVTNVGLALQGQTPGLVVTRSSPRPGNEGLAFTIRGASSVNGSDPLIIIDGVPVLNSSAFQNLNSDDIASVSILKDGAAAIYGSRASNGVILVTTKRGQGKLKVDYNGNFRFTTNGITGYSPSMSEYATMWLEANKEENPPNYWVWGNEENLLRMQRGDEGKYDLFGTDFYIYEANRLNEMFATRYSYQHNLSLSNSTEKSSYRLSLAYADNQGNLATAYDGQKQLNARFNYDYNLTDKLKLSSNISFTNAKTGSPSVGLDNTLFGYDMPFYPAKNPYGQWFATFNGIDGGATRNAAAMTTDGGRADRNVLTGRVDLKATYEIFKDLEVEALASIQNERFDSSRYVVEVPLYNWYGVQTAIGRGTGGTDNAYYEQAKNSYYQYYSALLRYTKNINDVHHISAVAGINAEKTNYRWISANRVGFQDLGTYDIGLASTENQTNSGFKSQNGRFSYLARLNYDYKERYLIEVLGRRDGNSRFAPGYKFKNFGSAQLGWVFTNENFLNGITSVINFGKVRATYGVSGNEASGLGAFDYLSTLYINTTVLGESPSQHQTVALNNNGLISYTRTWERVYQKNLGVDLHFFNNRLTTSFDLFEKDNQDMLVNVTYPAVLGGDAPKTNSGHFNTKGWEFVIGWRTVKENYGYNITFNISDSKTLVDGVEGKDAYRAGKNDIVNGYPWKPVFLYKTDGFFADQAEVDAYYEAFGSSDDLAGLPQGNAGIALRPGDVRKVDVAGTGNITSVGNEESSLVYAGDGTPHFTYGLNLGGFFKGFDLNVFFQGHLKQNILRQNWMAYPFQAIWTNQNPNFLGETWTEGHTDAPFPRLTVNPKRSKWNYENNDFMLQNNRYIRLKTLTLGYTLPESISHKVKLEKLRIYFSGNDLWEATSIKDGFDPEMGEKSVDNNGYPFARTWSFGVNIGF